MRLTVDCGHLRHEIEYLQKLVADVRAAKEATEKERDGLTGLLSAYSRDADRWQNQAKQLEAQIESIEAEHGQELRAMRSFSMDLEERLEEAQDEAQQEAKRANNAALRAERNALKLKELRTVTPNPVVLRRMADEVMYSHEYVAVKLRQYAERIEGLTAMPEVRE